MHDQQQIEDQLLLVSERQQKKVVRHEEEKSVQGPRSIAEDYKKRQSQRTKESMQ